MPYFCAREEFKSAREDFRYVIPEIASGIEIRRFSKVETSFSPTLISSSTQIEPKFLIAEKAE